MQSAEERHPLSYKLGVSIFCKYQGLPKPMTYAGNYVDVSGESISVADGFLFSRVVLTLCVPVSTLSGLRRKSFRGPCLLTPGPRASLLDAMVGSPRLCTALSSANIWSCLKSSLGLQ